MDSIISNGPETTLAVASSVAGTLAPGDIVAIYGPMGAGKTHFVKGLARALGYDGEVTSPTFTLVHEYMASGRTIYHLDLYRLETPMECLRLGVEDIWDGDGITAIEWPEKLGSLLPTRAKKVIIDICGENQRAIFIS